ncbi:unnamed protein product [Menidia menidia]|uniref:(Atlantic silverside) hypothetical protein n=1 Tax=Menidia menidia TaxID=238744 RepID=A0A8S4AGB5_9TELE|nr:unnamed protein product [Menidia menidia]
MFASNSTPYGVKSLLECMSRASLLAQPDNIPRFLSTHVKKMLESRDDDSRDIKEVAFGYQEQWAPLQSQKKKQQLSKPPDSAYVCVLTDCPYHNKQGESRAADGLSWSIEATKEPKKTEDLGLQGSNGEQRSFTVPASYRPKGGHVVDPELLQKRGRAAAYGREAFSGSRAALLCALCTNIPQLSHESSMHTCRHEYWVFEIFFHSNVFRLFRTSEWWTSIWLARPLRVTHVPAQVRGRPEEQEVLQQHAHLGQVGLHDLGVALLDQPVARGRAVPAVEGPHRRLRGHAAQVGHLAVVLGVVAHAVGAGVAYEEAPVRAVEDLLHELQQADGDAGPPGPRRGQPVVQAGAQGLGDHRPQVDGHLQGVEGAVAHALRHVQVPAEAQQLGGVLLLVQGHHQEELVDVEESPDGLGLRQRHFAVLVDVGQSDDPVHQEVPRVGLSNKLISCRSTDSGALPELACSSMPHFTTTGLSFHSPM